MEQDGFYTFKGYQLHETEALTSSMEDYLEMICRLLAHAETVRVSDLAEHLHVKPSSASKMVGNLTQEGYLTFQRYGHIAATQKGREAGAYLLYRHEVVHRFLCLLNDTENELEQVEKMEHFLTEQTVRNLERLVQILEKLPFHTV